MFRLLLLAVVLVVILALSLDSLLRVYMEHNLRAQTGMDAEIGRVSLGWFEPRLEISDLKIYNTADYGGTLFLNIREIYAEYDRRALRRLALHLTLLRFNLGELDIVKNAAGGLNILPPGMRLPAGVTLPPGVTLPGGGTPSAGATHPAGAASPSGPTPPAGISGTTGGTKPAAMTGAEAPGTATAAGPGKKTGGGGASPAAVKAEFAEKTGLSFEGIDALNVSVGTLKYIDLKDQRNNRTQKIDLENVVVANVTNEVALIPLTGLIKLRSGDFFNAVLGMNDAGAGGGLWKLAF